MTNRLLRLSGQSGVLPAPRNQDRSAEPESLPARFADPTFCIFFWCQAEGINEFFGNPILMQLIGYQSSRVNE